MGAIALLASVSSAQQVSNRVLPDMPTRHLGTYSVATGTLDKGSSSFLGNADILYRNDKASGYFGVNNAQEIVYEVGRLPAASGVGAHGTHDCYEVDGFQIGYCATYDATGTGGITGNFNWYNSFNDCQSPSGTTPTHSESVTGLPSLFQGAGACWTLDIDLTGASFVLEADADGSFDNLGEPWNNDTFGVSMNFDGGQPIYAGGGVDAVGPLIKGNHADDRDVTGGFGTTFNPTPNAPYTGLGTADGFWVTPDPLDTIGAGCYWYGGAPIWGGYHMLMTGAGSTNCGGSGGPFTNVCDQSTDFSTGDSTMSGSGSGSISANDLVISADGLPGQPGIFIANGAQAAIPFFNGILCISPSGLQRFSSVTFPSGGVVTVAVDYATSAAGGLNVVAGAPYYYQRWNRDPAAGGGNANFSDALQVDHTN